MKPHSNPHYFELDKFSYFDYIFNCTDYSYDEKEVELLQKKLLKVILPKLAPAEKSEVMYLTTGIIVEARTSLLRALSAMDCIKIELSNHMLSRE